ncbi:hypothetical protein OK016_19945 [Vibrio chagasii]|nr:hypothetical protein [Vibrio chagasii]
MHLGGTSALPIIELEKGASLSHHACDGVDYLMAFTSSVTSWQHLPDGGDIIERLTEQRMNVQALTPAQHNGETTSIWTTTSFWWNPP